MRAARCKQYGPPEGLVIENLPVPAAATGEALIRVEAASLNFPDLLMLANRYQVSIAPPYTPGCEFAGTVAAIGEGVTNLRVGNRIIGKGTHGAFAEFTTAPANYVDLLPDGIEWIDAAAFGVTYMTAYHAVRTFGRVSPGEWVVVLGAGGGVGLAAIDVARALGARVVAAASSDAKLEACRKQGAEAVVNYARDDLRQAIREVTGAGADVVVDPVGGTWTEAALRSTRWGGRFVVVGFASGEIPRIPLNLVLLKGVIVTSVDNRTMPQNAPELTRMHRAELMELFAAGKLKPYVSAVYPLERVAEALRDVADRRAIGKIVIRVGPCGDSPI